MAALMALQALSLCSGSSHFQIVLHPSNFSSSTCMGSVVMLEKSVEVMVSGSMPPFRKRKTCPPPLSKDVHIHSAMLALDR